MDLDRALDVARETAAEAAAVVMRGYRTPLSVRHKGATDLVTEWDLASEELVRARLAAAFPGHRIVAEEGEDQGSGQLVWYVDPLDGTTNFAHGHPFFAVSIALYDGADPLAGVVAAPAIGVTWSARRGGGAFRNGEPCRVSRVAELRDALCATGFPYDRWTNPDDNVREAHAFLKSAQGLRRCGSASMDLALVADGTYDTYWEQRLKPWDVGAGALLVLEAGGRISDYHGGPADPRTGRLVASNGLVHQATLAILGDVRAQIAAG